VPPRTLRLSTSGLHSRTQFRLPSVFARLNDITAASHRRTRKSDSYLGGARGMLMGRRKVLNFCGAVFFVPHTITCDSVFALQGSVRDPWTDIELADLPQYPGYVTMDSGLQVKEDRVGQIEDAPVDYGNTIRVHGSDKNTICKGNTLFRVTVQPHMTPRCINLNLHGVHKISHAICSALNIRHKCILMICDNPSKTSAIDVFIQ